MRKYLALLTLILGVLFSVNNKEVFARAGGGSASSGSSSNSESSGGIYFGVGGRSGYYDDYYYRDRDRYHYYGGRSYGNWFIVIIGIGIFFFIAQPYKFISLIRRLIAKSKVKRLLQNNGINYQELSNRISSSYFVIQNAWASGNMDEATNYMTPELLQNFQSKLNWQKYANKKNIMKDIKLLNAYPISWYNNNGEYLWVYLKGQMVDYVLDFAENEMVDGSTVRKSFVEYWLFRKNEKGEWVLGKILQKNEFNKVVF